MEITNYSDKLPVTATVDTAQWVTINISILDMPSIAYLLREHKRNFKGNYTLSLTNCRFENPVDATYFQLILQK